MKHYFSILLFILITWASSSSAISILNRGNGAEPDSLKIHQAQGINAHNILRDLYEGLMTVDANGKPEYGIAENHQIKGNTWIFTLKESARWSNGKPVVAQDFVRAWRKAIDPQTAAPYSFLFDNIIHAKKIMHMKLTPENLAVKAIDDHTLSIALWKQDTAFLEKLTLPIFFPLPAEQHSNADNKLIISNGPYHMSEWNIQEKVVLKKNPYYYHSTEVYFDQINYWVTDNQSSELKRFRAGELDITETIPDSQIDWIKKNLKDELRITPYLGSFFLGLNLKNEHLSNHHLRKALSLAIDRGILTEKVLKSGQVPAYGIIPQALINHTNPISKLTQEQRTIEAKKALNDSKVNIHELKIEILYNSSDNQRKVALAIAAMWRQTLGIRSQLVNQEWKVFVQSRKSIQRQAFRSGWIADYADAMSFLNLFISHSEFNFYRYNNSAYDEIVDQISKSEGTETKIHMIEQAENLLMHDIPVIPLYYYVSRHLVNHQILGFNNNVADRHLSKHLYKQEQKL